MALTFSLPSNHPARVVGLELWMDRVVERADQVWNTWDADGVHDLRVALRRCRTIADASERSKSGPGLAQAETNDPRPVSEPLAIFATRK